MRKDVADNRSDRRKFLGYIGGATAATVVAGVVGSPSSLLSAQVTGKAEKGLSNDEAQNDLNQSERGGDNRRAQEAFKIRKDAALEQRQRPFPEHPVNGDEERYANRIGSYSKALPHDSAGVVLPFAYNALLRAMETGKADDFAAIPSGGTVKQGNPQAALAFELCGADSHHLGIPAPPAFSSEEEAGEMAEVYWQALTRDVPFSQYGGDPQIAAAVSDLRRFSRFSGVTPATIFRTSLPGDLTGAYISQFLWKNVPYGAQTIVQQYNVPLSGDDHMTSYSTWLSIQNGAPPIVSNAIDPTARYIRNGRDLSRWLQRDYTYQGFLNAALILLSFGPQALDSSNPYLSLANQGGFATFGGPHILDLVSRAANLALKCTWYQKWLLHRRVRPEAFGGNVHNHKVGVASYPIHSKLLNSSVLPEVFSRYGTYLLPMAYPEGSPTHPAYPAGHAAIAGACVTVLKAFFNETFPIPSPVQATSDGLLLVPYNGQLTVGGELNKLAANISIGRDTAGVHWRSDGIEGIDLGEAVAISLLRDYHETFNESFDGFSLTTFDGRVITV